MVKKPKKKANIAHIAHQVNVTGTGAHKNKKKVLPRKQKHKGEKYE